MKPALTPAPQANACSLLNNTYWIADPEHTLAYELQGNNLGTVGLPKTDPPTATRILNQTVYSIQDVDPPGHSWGYVAIALANPGFFPDLIIDNYALVSPISGSGLLAGQALTSLGFSSTTPGLLASWTITGSSVPGPLPLFGAATAFAHSRRLRARLRTGSSSLLT